MDQAARSGGGRGLADGRAGVSAAFDGTEPVSEARALAGAFLEELRAVHGLPVSDRATGMVQLVVSELVTNARKYASGPCLLHLEAVDTTVEVTVWDSNPTLPVARATDPGRVGQHGLEIARAVCRDLEVHREPVGKRIKATVVVAERG